jgi:hypothetical protein
MPDLIPSPNDPVDVIDISSNSGRVVVFQRDTII